MRAMSDGKRLVLTPHRDVEQRLEDPELRREQRVHRQLRSIRAVADRLDGRRGIAALDEEAPGRLDDGRPGTAGTRLAAGSLVPAAGLDISIHIRDSTPIETRVQLSIRSTSEKGCAR